jgi:recombinational DNA repair protein (RecF pathway)
MITLPKRETAGLFLAADRCDRCGARAQVRAVLTTGELLFCNHHAHKHRTALEPVVLWFERGAVAA